MIFGITLKHFAKLKQQGENAKASARTARLLQKPAKSNFKTKSIEEITFSEFVDLERLIVEENYIDFCAIFVRRKFWQTIYIHNLWAILEDYNKQKEQLIEKFYYVFNPPQYGEPAKETIGTELRNEFVQEFGNYVIVMDVICKGKFVDYKTIEQWKTKEVLFWAHYLYGQRIVENVK